MAVHNISRGDTLSGLAQRYGTSVDALAKANNISNPDLIIAGKELTIPDGFDAPAGGRPSTGMPGSAPAGGAAAPGGAAPAGGPNAAAPVGAAPNAPPGSGVSLDQLRAIMPNLSAQKAQEYLPHLNNAMAEAGINTPRQKANFLAQLAHESGQFRYMEEIASGAAYEGRRDLGNTQPGDGTRFKGRGPIQLTGRANYQAAGRALGIDLVNNPTAAASPEVGFRTAAWFWNTRGLNNLAEQGNFREVTRRINGGFNGLADRQQYYNRALSVLGG
ncbi:MAG TPA: glycoside hydrolase family 19 protein [Hyalangium sp.]|nr:glycoside hydrolase family 19 protein [Hyalangium sp.]